ncbi:MAG TPA: ATP-binding protein [Acidimicrobiales bacterium]
MPGIRRRQTFDPAPSSARSARRFVAGVLQEAGFSGDVDTVLLLVSEVVTNAVRHAGSELTVLVELVDDEVTVTVADESDDVAMVKEPTTDATTGRGMFIVEQLATRWGLRPTPGGGKAVWFSCC